MLEPLSKYVDAARRLLAREFAREYADPILLLDPFEPTEDLGFRTNASAETGTGLVSMVGTIKKRQGANAFASMVTVGRAQNNDITIPSTTVSKFHCYFMLAPTGVTLADAGSTNGTFHCGKKLESKTGRCKLASGDEISLGELRAIFLAGEDAWQRLRDSVSTGRTPRRVTMEPGPSSLEERPTKRIERP